jgi:perosamine synthetase
MAQWLNSPCRLLATAGLDRSKGSPQRSMDTQSPFVPWSRKLPRGQLYFDPWGVLWDTLHRLGPHPPAGSVVRRFERAFAAALQAPFGVALPHARVALHYLLRVLDFPPGTEVVMTPVTIPEIVNIVLIAGLRPVFVDLAPRTCNIDCDDLERKITPRTRLLLLTHLCGLPSEMDRVMAIAQRHGLEVLEDCSQVAGTAFRGRPLGVFGRAGFMSLTPLKPVSTFHGGMTVTADAAIERELRRLDAAAPPPLPRRTLLYLLIRDNALHGVTNLTNFSWVTYYAVRAGEALWPEVVREFQRGNLLNAPARRWQVTRVERLPEWMYARYSDYQAATGLRMLPALAEGNRRRRDLSLYLLQLLQQENVPGLLRLPVDENECTFWRFPLWLEKPATPSALRRHLLARGIDSAATNLACCSREAAFAELAAETPEARRFVDEMIFLPMHPNLTEADMRRIAAGVASYYAGLR